MKVAVLGDIHGNRPALEVLLRDVRRRRPNAIWNLGDLVGYGPYPEEVVQSVKSSKIVSIAGNFDRRVLDWRPGPPADEEAGYRWLAAGWTHENLSPGSLAFLASLPPERRAKIGGRAVLLTHGSPASNAERLEPTTPVKRLRELAMMAKADIVMCGHSHIPWVRQVDGVWFVNPGGVGRSDDGDPRASYAILEITDGEVHVVHRRVAYDVKSVAEAIRRYGLPDVFARMFLESKRLDAVKVTKTADRSANTLNNVLGMAQRYQYEIGHAHQVTRLSMDLFDALRAAHHLGDRPRRWLLYAAILHDIGWVEGRKGHHKASLRIIKSARALGLPPRERQIVACVARYHRGPHPRSRHRAFASLSPRDRGTVSTLSAILRVADGLDRTHRNVVVRLSARITPREVRIACQVRGPSDEERRFAMVKGRLLTEVFDRELVVTCKKR